VSVTNRASDRSADARANAPSLSGDTRPMPRHVAIIMDGNGRWATQRGLPRVEGHRRGVESVRGAVRACREIGIPYLTIFSFSSENWSRPATEISDLMGLLKRFIRRDLVDLHKNNVKVIVIGERSGIDEELQSLIGDAEQRTRDNTGLKLIIAFNYGSRLEIARAARRLAERVERGELRAADITPEVFEQGLDTHVLPDPDLLIRTSGELRLSNFLLWQSAYTEFVFLEIYWPDFTKETLLSAIEQYHGRDRRFGGVTPAKGA
jgi:undecaprenyl diphosphate synthase